MSEKRPGDELTSHQAFKRQRLATTFPPGIKSDTQLNFERLCVERNFDAIEMLVKQQNTISNFSFHREPLMCFVCRDGPLSLLESLLQAGADISRHDIRGRTAMHVACELGRFDAVKLILMYRGKRCLRYVDYMRWSPLWTAFQNEHYEICAFLLSKGARGNTRDNKGRTMLHIACSNGPLWWKTNLSFIERLLVSEPKVDVGAADDTGNTPLNFACQSGNLEAIYWLLDHGIDAEEIFHSKHTPLISACAAWGTWWQDQKTVIDLLLSRGAPVDQGDRLGRTVLHHACDMAYFDLVEFLLSRGANIHAVTGSGNTPLHFACYADEDDLHAFPHYLSSSMENMKDNRQVLSVHRPLSLANQSGKLSVVELLLAHGARTYIKNSNGDTPIRIACSCGHADIVKAIVGVNRDSIKDKDYRDRTLAHIACGYGDVEVVRALLLIDESLVNQKDSNGCTPIDLALGNGHVEVVKVLLTIDESLANGKDCDKHSPLYFVLHSDEISGDVQYKLVVILLSFGARPLPPGDLPNDLDPYLAFIVTNFPMLLLYQMFRLICDPNRIQPRKSTLITQDMKQWRFNKTIQAMLRHDISWDLHRMILQKTLIAPQHQTDTD